MMQVHKESEYKLWLYTAVMQACRVDFTRNERHALVAYATSGCCGFVALPLSAPHYILILINMGRMVASQVSVATRKFEKREARGSIAV